MNPLALYLIAAIVD